MDTMFAFQGGDDLFLNMWKRQLTEPKPTKVSETPLFEASDTVWRQHSEPAPGLEQDAMWRQLSEPAKVYMTSLSKTLGLELDEDDMLTTGPGTPDQSISTSPRVHSPSLKFAEDPLLPRWVAQVPKSIEADLFAPGLLQAQAPAAKHTALVHGLPTGFTETMFLEELRDGGFKKGRDITGFQFDSAGGCIMVNLSNTGVLRAFLAAFEGRPIRNFSRVFRVLPMGARPSSGFNKGSPQNPQALAWLGQSDVCSRCNSVCKKGMNFCSQCGTRFSPTQQL